jgi:hypothetical protein
MEKQIGNPMASDVGVGTKLTAHSLPFKLNEISMIAGAVKKDSSPVKDVASFIVSCHCRTSMYGFWENKSF